jgi:hypothetical protein
LQTIRDSFSFLLERSKTQAVLSFVTDLAIEGKVRNLGYPIPVVGQSTATAGQQANVLPIGVEMYIPTFIIHWNPSPEIGWWDAVPSAHNHMFVYLSCMWSESTTSSLRSADVQSDRGEGQGRIGR